MNWSNCRNALHGSTAVLAAAAIAAAITVSGPSFANSPGYRFEVVQVASAGPGKSDITVRLVRTSDATPVSNAEIYGAVAAGSVAEQVGRGRFRVETVTAGSQTLQVSAKVPGATRIERTFNSSVKVLLERKVRGRDEVVDGTVVFDVR